MPSTSRLFGSKRPTKEHMTRGGGYAGEVRDLRKDTEAAFLQLEAGGLSLADGFTIDVLPSQNDRASILAAGNSIVNVAISTATWHTIAIEILVKNPTAAHYYIYRNQIEAYRDGAGAILHLNPLIPNVEEPSGGFGFYSVTIGAAGNNVTVRLDNASANTINFTRYIGSSRKPIP